VNLPNKITISRFFVPPLFLAALWLYSREGKEVYYCLALIVFVLGAISDGLDGYLARSRGMTTKLGTVLDPLADKFFLNSAVVGMALLTRAGHTDFPVPTWFAVLMVGRDLLILSGGAVVRLLRGKVEVRPTLAGKFTAVAEMAVVIWLLLRIPRPEFIIWTTSVGIAVSGAGYLASGWRQLRRVA